MRCTSTTHKESSVPQIIPWYQTTTDEKKTPQHWKASFRPLILAVDVVVASSPPRHQTSKSYFPTLLRCVSRSRAERRLLHGCGADGIPICISALPPLSLLLFLLETLEPCFHLGHPLRVVGGFPATRARIRAKTRTGQTK